MEHIEDLGSMGDLEDLMSENGGAAILDFWSPTCAPCMAMAPAFEAVAEDFADEPIRFIRINTATHAHLSSPFNIHAVPTILFVNDGQILDVRVGALSGPALRKKAQWLLRRSRGEGMFSRLFGGKA